MSKYVKTAVLLSLAFVLYACASNPEGKVVNKSGEIEKEWTEQGITDNFIFARGIGAADQTLTNIELLLSQKNLARHGAPGAGATLRDLAKLRVYVKRPQDYPIIRKVCEKRCGKNIPIIYVMADVCRSDLLVEMEGLAFVRRSAKGRRIRP